ncbi:Anti-sigma-K factor RskA [Bradyrhizobium canariense]|uniref:Anti-sigma-K factor RskA n=2 Tax=Bradyrhizobium canariense TaxID=255045 RepID=A0A1H1WXC6_9BRAD|nr:Anti-sigma-K factor RskA [Bradyrhizobium canariense]
MMAHSEDHIALAAEYALGTLDVEERTVVEAMMSVDKDFAAMVEAWQQKLGALNQMVGSVEPRPEVWDKIRTAVGLSEHRARPVLPQTPLPPAASEVDRPVAAADISNVIRLSAQARRWRNVATITSAIAAALVAMIAVGIYQPDLLPAGLRPKPQTQVVEVVKAPSPTPPSAQYVAVLQKDGGAPGFILTVDGATKSFTIRKVGATAPDPGKSFELWLISDRLPRPRSLGVIGSGDFTARPVLASYDTDIINAATYAVTVEQAGGSPDGNPHSAPVFTGKLIETVPPR